MAADDDTLTLSQVRDRFLDKDRHVRDSAFVASMFCKLNSSRATVITIMSNQSQTALYLQLINCVVSALTYHAEMNVIKRETINKWYSLQSYFLSKTITSSLELTTTSFAFVGAIFFFGDYSIGVWRTMAVFAVVIMVALLSESVGMVIGVKYCNDLPTAALIASVLIIPMCFFSGFFVRLV